MDRGRDGRGRDSFFYVIIQNFCKQHTHTQTTHTHTHTHTTHGDVYSLEESRQLLPAAV